MRKILVIASHMDDEVLGCGGTISRHVDDGDLVRVCFVCNRAYEHKYVAELINKEKDNALKAKSILGYQEHIFLDLDDERLDERSIDVIVPIEKVVQEFSPQVIFIPHKGDNNQDHGAVFQASMIALRTFHATSIEKIYACEIPSSSEQSAPSPKSMFIPNSYVNIKKFIEKKKEALSCYEKEKRIFPHPRSVKAIEVLAMKRGVDVYLEYAEAFELIRMIRR